MKSLAIKLLKKFKTRSNYLLKTLEFYLEEDKNDVKLTERKEIL